jgi:hypothetical protein
VIIGHGRAGVHRRLNCAGVPLAAPETTEPDPIRLTYLSTRITGVTISTDRGPLRVLGAYILAGNVPIEPTFLHG